jgi:hypothetical protein
MNDSRDPERDRAFQQSYARAREALSRLPNVVGVGLGSKETSRRFTDDLAIIVFVREKIPESQLSADERVPPTFEGYKTDVRIVDHPHPGACDNETVSPTIQGGIQITLKPVTTPAGVVFGKGTLGCIVRRRNDTARENAYALSNKHVLYGTNSGANENAFHPLPPEMPPGHGVILGPVMAGGTYDNISFLNDPTSPLVDVFVDCAVARLNVVEKSCCCTCEGLKTDDTILDLDLNGSNRMLDVRNTVGQPEFRGETVWKVGRTTGKTRGVVRLVDASFITSDPTIAGSPLFTAQNTIAIEFEPDSTNTQNCHGHTWFAEVGDSGSIVVDDENNVVGIISQVPNPAIPVPAFELSYACHIVPVLDHLGICIPCSRGGAHGSTTATDGSGLQPSPKNPPHANDEFVADGQVVFAGPLIADNPLDTSLAPPVPFSDDDAHAMRSWLTAFRSTPLGRGLLDTFDHFQGEVGYLIRHARPVTVAWHRGKGPAFLAHVLNHLAGHTERVPHQVQGVTRADLLTRMRTALEVHASNPLRERLTQHGDALFAIATDATGDTVADWLRLAQEQVEERG